MSTSTLITSGNKISREELASIPTPEATRTHRPVPHHEIAQALIETLSFRHIAVLKDEYAVSSNGMKMFGVLDLEAGFEGCHFSIGIRNSHDKSFRLSATAGLRVAVCDNMMFQWGLHARVGKALQELFTARQPLHWSRSHAAELRAHEAAGGAMAGSSDP
jgi:hypothetical protein